DFPIHASTQMTITSANGVKFAKSLGCQLVVLARECSIEEINKIQKQITEIDGLLPLEIFVHGALCVAYSGQCLTSEALGGRSANRGECAQACRMPYQLIADGKIVDLGDKKYLLSPQDLAGLEVLPDLVKSGVTCLKIEGRLKTPEYVANVTRVYREALDKAIAKLTIDNNIVSLPPNQDWEIQDKERYKLEMAFSRGLYTGWLRGINNQELVHARFGKKRGVYLGEVTKIEPDKITIRCHDIGIPSPIKPGDGVVFDGGHPEAKEEGGRIYSVAKHNRETILTFGRGNINIKRIHIGDKIWKTSDPELAKEIRQSFTGETPQFQRPIHLEIDGEIGKPLNAIAKDEIGNTIQIDSTIPLASAHTQPLTTAKLQQQFSRLGNTPFYLGKLTNRLDDKLMIPVSELNRMRREIVKKLEELRAQPKPWQLNSNLSYQNLLPNQTHTQTNPSSQTNLIILVRNIQQLKAALTKNIHIIYCELEDPKKYREAVEIVRQKNAKNTPDTPETTIWVAPPRITKPGENYILQQVRNSNAHGYLLRNYDHLEYFSCDRTVADFSLNIANPLTADYFKNTFQLERLTPSYDLNITQLTELIKTCPPDWFEVTIHQHIPMFHLEHCVFCAFLSQGTDYTNCGRPCEKYEVKLQDRVGTQHILQADAGCRNTLFNGTPQTGAEYIKRLIEVGVNYFRIEFLNETGEEVTEIIHSYQELLAGEITGSQLWQKLKLQNQLGVTRGALI
ncbi:MAG TPA: peptidase U32, partial [Cyanobacteria bacterium UBA11149]|nr:peptidase U32 [Cyanobacteria bacterium UBA11367]HBW91261.1 peptidase U32 [Cyanobacteria bacterium UBA11149]